MRNRLKNAVLKTPAIKAFELALVFGAATVYAGSYVAAAHISQILAAVACVIGLLIITDTIPVGHDDH